MLGLSIGPLATGTGNGIGARVVNKGHWRPKRETESVLGSSIRAIGDRNGKQNRC
ncbi:hypothetical protein [Bacillus sp. X1(2014)]|uniref:hypothetical protein n=1 Tax=Bacillus sp. X1(2014) TaxID=1565991 RepID=UPI001642CE6F|nr:hypothetical protein [Bacillus sp. X1(2014)]